jgi:putative ABC transport system ATP-binding protein
MRQGTSPLIELKDVSKVFFTDDVETRALSHVDLVIRLGEFVCISGPSGCGKTTLLSIIGLLDTATSGRYLLKGRCVDNLGLSARARLRSREIGFIFQNFNLIGDMTVRENVELPLTYRGMRVVKRRLAAQGALDRVSMSHRLHHFPSQLSGGEQQRVAVARALAGQPSILLADEPTGNLDSVTGEAVMELLACLHQDGATIAMVTHNPEYATLAERQVRLLDGQIVPAETLEAAPILEHQPA